MAHVIISCQICGRTSPTWKGLHRHIPSHDLRAVDYYRRFPQQLRDRVFSYVSVELIREDLDIGECWVWTAGKTEQGYGRMRVAGLDTCCAHRISYMAHVGKIGEDLVLMHKCDHPPCVNPQHLEPGTVHENNTDRARKNRSHRVLTDDTVFRVRELLGWGWAFEKIRDDTGAGLGSIAQIRDGRAHAHVVCDPNVFLF